MKAFHQYDQKGNHRLGVSAKVKGDLTKDGSVQWGEWRGYTSPAVIKRGETTLVCCTDYHSGSVEFPRADHVYLISHSNYPEPEVSQTEA